MKMNKWLLGLAVVIMIIVIVALFRYSGEDSITPELINNQQPIDTEYQAPPPDSMKSTFNELNNISGIVMNTPSELYPVDTEFAFNDIGYEVESEQKFNHTHKLWMYDSLPSGQYRIIKDFIFLREPGDYDKYMVSARFQIQ